MLKELKDINIQEFAVKKEPIEDCTIQPESPKWYMP